ncbi:MAG TPA: hypothetical protein VMF11_04750 [Candidatus Baltobacteraceae bacterium]|nr:hypothetical protein [Candidatus Baltobacteraceae bacterium]
MQARGFRYCTVALALLLCGAAAHPAKTPPQTLRAFVALMLDQAPVNYANMRGAVKDSDVFQIRYDTKAQFDKTCAKCIITDQFAWTGHPEHWSLEQRWNAKNMTPAQVTAYVKAQLAPIIKGYALKTTGSKEYPTFTWRNGAKGLWISVDTYNGGFTPSIGQDLTKPVHVLKPPTVADIQSLRNSVTNFVSLGVGPASENFSTLRTNASKDILGSPTYDLSVSFGSMLRDCSITDDTANTLNLSDYSPKWTMTCNTVPMVGGKEIEAEVQAAMAAAVPSGFTPTTDKYLGLDDYRWDNTSTQIAVDIDSFSSYSLPSGLVSYGVGIIHFLPAPAST